MVATVTDYQGLVVQLGNETKRFASRAVVIFEKLDWKWSIIRNNEYVYAVPTEKEIEEQLNNLIVDCFDNFKKTNRAEQSFSAGRLQVRINLHDNRLIGTLELVPFSIFTTKTI